MTAPRRSVHAKPEVALRSRGSATYAGKTLVATELSSLVAILATMSDLCVQILQRITQDDVRAVYPLSDQLRQMRSELADLLNKKLSSIRDFQPNSPIEFRQIEQLQLGVRIVSKFDQVHAEWSVLLADPESEDARVGTIAEWHALMEKRLPAMWDLRRDLLAIVGLPPEELILAVEERGQQRVMAFQVPSHSALVAPAENVEAASVGKAATETALAAETSGPVPSEDSLFAAAVDAERIRWVKSLEDTKRLYFSEDPPRFIVLLHAESAQSRDFSKKVQSELDSLHLLTNVSRNTLRAFGPRWFNQGLDNLHLIAASHPLAELRGKFAGIPAVLVSPGPSLDRNIRHLEKLQGKAIIIAPGQSIKRLHQSGIFPDFVAVIDPQDLTSAPFPFFDSTLIRDHQALLVGGTCHPNVMSLPYPRKYVFGSSTNAAWIDDIFGDELVNIGGGSVAVSALNIAIEWGCNPIVLVGQDLAFTGGKQYAGTHQTADDDAGLLSKAARGAVFEVEGYYGGTVHTPYGYKAALYEMEALAEQLLKTGNPPAIYNATEGGANIKGFVKEPLEQIVARFALIPALRYPVWSMVETNALVLQERKQYGSNELQRIRGSIRELTATTESCVHLCERLKIKPGAKLLNRLGKIEKKMRVSLRSVGFLALAVQDEIEEIRASVDEQATLAENLDASLALYKTILSACGTASAKIDAALDRMDGKKTPLQFAPEDAAPQSSHHSR